jgi:hypothetical protein
MEVFQAAAVAARTSSPMRLLNDTAEISVGVLEAAPSPSVRRPMVKPVTSRTSTTLASRLRSTTPMSPRSTSRLRGAHHVQAGEALVRVARGAAIADRQRRLAAGARVEIAPAWSVPAAAPARTKRLHGCVK